MRSERLVPPELGWVRRSEPVLVAGALKRVVLVRVTEETLALLVIWLLWSRGSMTAAVALSHAKHDTARWLESVGGSNGFYKSSRHVGFAMDRSEAATANYVSKHP